MAFATGTVANVRVLIVQPDTLMIQQVCGRVGLKSQKQYKFTFRFNFTT